MHNLSVYRNYGNLSVDKDASILPEGWTPAGGVSIILPSREVGVVKKYDSVEIIGFYYRPLLGTTASDAPAPAARASLTRG